MKPSSAIVMVLGGLAASSCLVAARPSPRPPLGSAVVQIHVTNVRAQVGRVHVDICREAEFLKDCPVFGEAKAVAGTTIVTVNGLLPGDYAAQIFYDENGNGKVDRALFGIPKEGVGFSNDAPIRLGPPRWSEAMFHVSGDKTIAIKLRYFMGGDAKR